MTQIRHITDHIEEIRRRRGGTGDLSDLIEVLRGAIRQNYRLGIGTSFQRRTHPSRIDYRTASRSD